MGGSATPPTFQASPPPDPPAITGATFFVGLNRLDITFAGPIASLGAFGPSEWELQLDSGVQAVTPASWTIVGGNTVRISDWVPSPAAAFTDRFRKTGGSAINFVGGASLTTIDWTPMAVVV